MSMSKGRNCPAVFAGMPVAIAILIACAIFAAPVTASGSGGGGMVIGMPNPAAAYAEEMGYGYEIRTDEQGNQYGVVILPDGTERDEWELYYETHPQGGDDVGQPGLIGMPNPAAAYAEEMGYGYEIRTDEQGNQYGVVILPDGTERDEWELYYETHPVGPGPDNGRGEQGGSATISEIVRLLLDEKPVLAGPGYLTGGWDQHLRKNGLGVDQGFSAHSLLMRFKSANTAF